jgi:hypothetical protein
MEIDSTGQKRKGYVYAGGELLAEQQYNQVTWQHTNPLTGSQGKSGVDGWYTTTIEADPQGVNVGVEDPFVDPEPQGFEPEAGGAMRGGMGGGGDCSNFNPTCNTCYWNNIEMDCAFLMTFVGAAGNGGEFWAWEDGGERLTPSPDEICEGCGEPDPDDPQQEPTDITRIHHAETKGVWTWMPFNGGLRTQQNTLSTGEVSKLRTNLVDLLKGKCGDFVARVLSELEGTGTKPFSTNAQNIR